jgi:hypothetical protein
MTLEMPLPPGDPNALRDAARRLGEVRWRVEELRTKLSDTVLEHLWPHWTDGVGERAAKEAYYWVEDGALAARARAGGLDVELTAWADKLSAAQEEVRHLQEMAEHTLEIHVAEDGTLRRYVDEPFYQELYRNQISQLAAAATYTRGRFMEQYPDRPSNSAGMAALWEPETWSA